MGFHVSLAELTKAATKLSQEAERLEEQLETAKKSVNKIITSEALTGQTGQAIYHQLNNVDAAILVGLADTTKLLASDMYQLIAEFQASVGETSTTAVLDEDYLNQLKDQLSNFKNQHGEQEEIIAGIYASVSDLISLSSPQSNYDTDSDAASQYLSNIIDKVTSFNSAGSELSSESLLTAIDSKVNQVSQTTSLSYSDSQYLSFVNDASFAKGIKSVNKQLKEQEKLAKEEAAKEAQAAWAKQHPVEAWLQSQAAKDAQFFEGARQTLEQTNWDYFGGALDKSLALSVLGFIAKASETVDQLAIGVGELSHLAVEGIEWGGNTLFNQTTPQWIKDDVTGATNNLLAASEFTDSLLALDAEAWGAVGKELGKIETDFVTAVKTGDDYVLGGYAFDVATLVGPASISKLKYVDEASALTKLAETSEVASTVGKVEEGVSLSFEKLMSAEDAQKYIQWNKYAEVGIEPEGRVKLLEISEKAPKVEYRPGKTPKDILMQTKGEKDSVETYLDSIYIEAHKQQFSNGAIKIQKFTPTENGFNNGAIGNPKDHVVFVMPKDVGETIIEVSKGNPRILEDILGLHPGDLGDSPVAIDIPPESIHNLKIPSGNEDSAFEGFWKPGGRTYPGDMPEAVIDEVPWGGYTIRTLGGK